VWLIRPVPITEASLWVASLNTAAGAGASANGSSPANITIFQGAATTYNASLLADGVRTHHWVVEATGESGIRDPRVGYEVYGELYRHDTVAAVLAGSPLAVSAAVPPSNSTPTSSAMVYMMRPVRVAVSVNSSLAAPAQWWNSTAVGLPTAADGAVDRVQAWHRAPANATKTVAVLALTVTGRRLLTQFKEALEPNPPVLYGATPMVATLAPALRTVAVLDVTALPRHGNASTQLDGPAAWACFQDARAHPQADRMLFVGGRMRSYRRSHVHMDHVGTWSEVAALLQDALNDAQAVVSGSMVNVNGRTYLLVAASSLNWVVSQRTLTWQVAVWGTLVTLAAAVVTSLSIAGIVAPWEIALERSKAANAQAAGAEAMQDTVLGFLSHELRK